MTPLHRIAVIAASVVALVSLTACGPSTPSAALGANAIVDTVTGAYVPIGDGGELRGGFYRADGNAVLRVIIGGADRVRLVSPAGAVLDEVIIPPAGVNHLLLGYAP
jgi:hypothetical protein